MGKHTSKGSAGKKSDSDSPETVVVGSGAGKIRLPRFGKRVYIVGAALAGVAVVIILVICMSTRHQLPSNITSVCTDDIAARADKYHGLGDAGSLTQLTYEIKRKAGYQNDPNCTYIVAEQQLLSGDVNSAQKTIRDLEKVYGKTYTFNAKLDGGKASLAKLLDQLRTMQSVEENSKGKFDPDI